MEEIVWFEKDNKGWEKKGNDISINKTKNGYSIIIRNDWTSEMSTTGFIRLGFSKDGMKLFFMAADKASGWKIHKIARGVNHNVSVSADRICTALARFEGEYNIEVSGDNICFIDRRNIL